MRFLWSLCLAVVAMNTSLAGQSPMSGFWVFRSYECTPKIGACSATIPIARASEVVIDVKADSLFVTKRAPSSNPWQQTSTDVVLVRGKKIVWSPGRTGVRGVGMATRTIPGDVTVVVDEAESNVGVQTLWPGESWQLSADQRTLVHKFVWKDRMSAKDSLRTVTRTWTYRRAAG